MKRIAYTISVMIFLAACGRKQPNIEGKYVTTNESNYSIATETLTIERTAKDAKDMFSIKKDVVYARKTGVKINGKDSLGKTQTKPSEYLTGQYDAENHLLVVPGLKNPFIVKDEGKTLSMDEVIYLKK